MRSRWGSNHFLHIIGSNFWRKYYRRKYARWNEELFVRTWYTGCPVKLRLFRHVFRETLHLFNHLNIIFECDESHKLNKIIEGERDESSGKNWYHTIDLNTLFFNSIVKYLSWYFLYNQKIIVGMHFITRSKS